MSREIPEKNVLEQARERLQAALLSTDKILPEHRQAFLAFRDLAAETAVRSLGMAQGNYVAAAIYLHSACGLEGDGKTPESRAALIGLYGPYAGGIAGQLLEKEYRYNLRIEGIGDLSPPAKNAMLAVEIANIKSKTADPNHPPEKTAQAIAFSRQLLGLPEIADASAPLRQKLDALVEKADSCPAGHGHSPVAASSGAGRVKILHKN